MYKLPSGMSRANANNTGLSLPPLTNNAEVQPQMSVVKEGLSNKNSALRLESLRESGASKSKVSVSAKPKNNGGFSLPQDDDN